MKKELLLLLIVFIFTFSCSLALLFPTDKFILGILNDISAKSKLGVHIDKVSTGFNSAVIENVSSQDIEIKKIHIKEFLLYPFNKTLSFDIKTDWLKLSGTLKKNNISAAFDLTPKKLVTIGQNINGAIKGNVTYNINDYSGIIFAESARLEINLPIGTIQLDDTLCSIKAKNQTLSIEKLTSSKGSKMDLKGTINISDSIINSFVNINGFIEINGERIPVNRRGKVSNLI